MLCIAEATLPNKSEEAQWLAAAMPKLHACHCCADSMRHSMLQYMHVIAVHIP
jgi:hypothetical protein